MPPVVSPAAGVEPAINQDPLKPAFQDCWLCMPPQPKLEDHQVGSVPSANLPLNFTCQCTSIITGPQRGQGRKTVFINSSGTVPGAPTRTDTPLKVVIQHD